MSAPERAQATIYPVQYTEVLDCWDQVLPVLSKVLERDGTHRPQDVLNELLSRRMQLWVVNDYQAVAVTQIQVYPLRKDLVVIWLAGDEMKEWLDELLYFLESFAQRKACKHVDAYGRRGWKKVLAPRGYEEEMIVVRKQVNG